MICVMCKGEGTTGKDQTSVCYNCFGSGEVGLKKPIKVTADDLPFTDIEEE